MAFLFSPECTQYLHNFGASLQTSKLGMTHITSSKTVVYLASKIRLVVFFVAFKLVFPLRERNNFIWRS